MTSRLGLPLFLIAIAALASADRLQWSSAVRGLRVGIQILQTLGNERILEVVIENQGTQVRNIDLPNALLGLAQNLQLRAVRNDETVEVFDTELLKAGIGGFIQSGRIQLAPGQRTNIPVPFTRLFCIMNGRELALQQMVDRGHSKSELHRDVFL